MNVETGTPNISVIVPVYNTEKYLGKCLDSLCIQTMKEIEIILIDDGSDDGSGKICDEYAQADPRFHVIHNKHEGVSSARNSGLEKAKARYVMFVDSDDWVDPNYCALPYFTAEKTGAALVVFQRMRHEGNKTEIYAPYHYEGVISKEEALIKRWNEIGAILTNKLYQRNLFDGIMFPIGRLCEDMAVIHRVIQKADNVFYLDQCLYHRLAGRPGSTMTERTSRMVIDNITFSLKRMLDLRQWGYDCSGKVKQQALQYLLLMGRKAELSLVCDRIIRENRGGTSESWKQDIAAGLYCISPGLFDLLSIISGKRISRQYRDPG